MYNLEKSENTSEQCFHSTENQSVLKLDAFAAMRRYATTVPVGVKDRLWFIGITKEINRKYWSEIQQLNN